MIDCPFCKPGFTKWGNIDRKWAEDDFTITTLAQGQEVRGYSLVIAKRHFTDITAPGLFWEGTLANTIFAVHKCARILKERLGVKRIYVASLCDGVEHLHFHLIPRYEWTDADKERYRRTFAASRSPEAIEGYIKANTIGGFWWMAGTETGDLPAQETEEFDLKLLKELEGI
jgi:diadenosine tetraphosphate (Ap4A) HIT family hydrolase